MPQSSQTKSVLDLLGRIIAHARTVAGDASMADQVVRSALASSRRPQVVGEDRGFVIDVLRTISQTFRCESPDAVVLSNDAVAGAVGTLALRDREALSLQSLFSLSPTTISQVMEEPAEVSEERLRRAIGTVETALVPRAIAMCP